jgi:hypothetical protein
MITLVAVFAALTQVTGQSVPPKEVAAAVDSLKKSEIFIIGPAGLVRRDRPPSPSLGEKALIAILDTPSAVTLLSGLAKEAPPAGRLYAVLGLRYADKAAYEASLKALRASDVKIQSIGGCIMYREKASVFADRIDRGLYDRFMKGRRPVTSDNPQRRE